LRQGGSARRRARGALDRRRMAEALLVGPDPDRRPLRRTWNLRVQPVARRSPRQRRPRVPGFARHRRGPDQDRLLWERAPLLQRVERVVLAAESARTLRLHGQVVKPLIPLAVAATVLAGTACVSSDDIEGLHKHINDVEKQVQAVERKSSSKEEVAKVNASVSQQTTQLLKSNADMGVKLNELTAKMEQLEAKLEDTTPRLSQRSQ